MSDTTLVRIKADDKKLIPPGSFLFTTKLSSFAKVIHLPVDYIKFDGSMIQGLLSKMNEMAKALNIRTVAEFVDSREVLTAAQRIRSTVSEDGRTPRIELATSQLSTELSIPSTRPR